MWEGERERAVCCWLAALLLLRRDLRECRSRRAGKKGAAVAAALTLCGVYAFHDGHLNRSLFPRGLGVISYEDDM